jgi:hypothetical protein
VREWQTRESLERGGDPPEGAHSPRARRSLARGGVQASSEAVFRRYGVVPLERSGVSPEAAGGDRLMGYRGCQGRGLLSPGRDCFGCNL